MENGKWKIYYKDSVISLSNLVPLSKMICSCLLSVFSGSASSASFTNKFKGSNLNTKITEIRMNGSSHQRCSLKNIFLRNFAKFTKKHLWIWQNFKNIKFQISKISKSTTFWQNTSGRLLLNELTKNSFLAKSLLSAIVALKLHVRSAIHSQCSEIKFSRPADLPSGYLFELYLTISEIFEPLETKSTREWVRSILLAFDLVITL